MSRNERDQPRINVNPLVLAEDPRQYWTCQRVSRTRVLSQISPFLESERGIFSSFVGSTRSPVRFCGFCGLYPEGDTSHTTTCKLLFSYHRNGAKRQSNSPTPRRGMDSSLQFHRPRPRRLPQARRWMIRFSLASTTILFSAGGGNTPITLKVPTPHVSDNRIQDAEW